MLFLCSTSADERKAEDAELEALLRQIAAGSSPALESLYRRTSTSVYGFALSILKNTHDTDLFLFSTSCL